MKFGKFYLLSTLILQLIASAVIIPVLFGFPGAVESFFWDLSLYFKSDLFVAWWWFAAVAIFFISLLLASVHAIFYSSASWWVRILWLVLFYLLNILAVPAYCLFYLRKLKHPTSPEAHHDSGTLA